MHWLSLNLTVAYLGRGEVFEPYLTVSQPYLLMRAEGSTPLYLDLDIFSHSTTTGDPVPLYKKSFDIRNIIRATSVSMTMTEKLCIIFFALVPEVKEDHI